MFKKNKELKNKHEKLREVTAPLCHCSVYRESYAQGTSKRLGTMCGTFMNDSSPFHWSIWGPGAERFYVNCHVSFIIGIDHTSWNCLSSDAQILTRIGPLFTQVKREPLRSLPHPLNHKYTDSVTVQTSRLPLMYVVSFKYHS